MNALQLTLLALFVLIAFLSSRAALCNFRHWHRMLREPAIRAEVHQLKTIKENWPANEIRWPMPFKGNQWKDRELCASYARLAGRKARLRSLVGDGLAVVGGPWLGITIPGILAQVKQAQMQQRLDAAVGDLSMNLTSFDFKQFLINTAPLYLIFIALILKYLSRSFEYMAEWYRRGAQEYSQERSAVVLRRKAGVVRRVWMALFEGHADNG